MLRSVIRRHTTGAKDESCLWVVFGIEPLVPDASVYSGTHQPARHVSSSSFLAVWSSNSVSRIDGLGRRRKFVVAVLRFALAPFSITSSLDNSSFLAGSFADVLAAAASLLRMRTSSQEQG